jgi:hypothetical protein
MSCSRTLSRMIRATFKTRATRSLCFDLESKPQAFWWGDKTTAEITAFGWKWQDEPDAHALLLCSDGRFANDDGLHLDGPAAYTFFRDVLAQSDLAYGHNIRGFDLPLFQSGLLRRSLPVLPQLRTTDTLKDYPKRKDMSASLENLAAMYGLDDQGGKKHMSIIDWEQANRLTPEGISLARERVVSDVLLQERLRGKLLELHLLKPPRMWSP